MPRLALVLLLVLAAPAPASAATASLALESRHDGGLSVIVRFDAGAGERNDVTVRRDGAWLVLRDAGAPVEAGEYCVPRDPGTVACGAPRSEALLAVHLGDGDDRYIARAPLAVSAARIDAGGGDDILDATGAISGGGGDDTLAGSDGGSTLSGGPGADRLDGRAGDDVLAGGEGDDRLVGGDGDDRLSGGGGDDEMDGGRGSNRLHGGAGHDGLTVWRPGRGSMPRNVLRCGGGSDSLFAPGIERLRLDPACERAAFDLVAIDGYDLTGKRLTLELRFPDRFGIRCRIRVATAAGEVAPVLRSRAAARIVEVPAPPGRVRLRLEARRPCIDFADGEGLTLILPRLRTR